MNTLRFSYDNLVDCHEWRETTPRKFWRTEIDKIPDQSSTADALALAHIHSEERQGAILYGPPDVGKSRVAHLLKFAWLKACILDDPLGSWRAVTIDAADLIEKIHMASHKGKLRELIDDFIGDYTAVILIDDLGQEDLSGGALCYLAGLKQIMDAASGEEIPMIVTTNHGPTALAKHWMSIDPACSPIVGPITSRLRRYFRSVRFTATATDHTRTPPATGGVKSGPGISKDR